MATVRWVIELDAADAALLETENRDGNQFTLRCGIQQVTPVSVTEAEAAA